MPGADLGRESHTQPTRQPGRGPGPGDGAAFALAPDDLPRASPDGEVFSVVWKPPVEVFRLSHQTSGLLYRNEQVSEGYTARHSSCVVTERKSLGAVE